MTIRIGLLVIYLVPVLRLAGQDIHFSQYMAVPMLVNPALAGDVNEQLRVGMNYRNQGSAISTPYKTCSASIDGVIQPLFLKDDAFGVGGEFYNDKSGDGSLQKSSAMVTLAFHKGFNRFGTLRGSVGFSVGVVNLSVDYSKLVFGSQWNGVQFDPGLPANEPYTSSSVIYPDLNAGFVLSYNPDLTKGISAGISLSHINKPYESFYNGSARLGWKWIVNADAMFRTEERWSFEPGGILIVMNGLSEIMVGSNIWHGTGDLGLCAGLWYRVGRDVIPVVGLNYKRYRLLFSYDITISTLAKASWFNGGLEISLQKMFTIPTKGRPCEKVRFY